jgi:hypothetical protein
MMRDESRAAGGWACRPALAASLRGLAGLWWFRRVAWFRWVWLEMLVLREAPEVPGG